MISFTIRLLYLPEKNPDARETGDRVDPHCFCGAFWETKIFLESCRDSNLFSSRP
jgi:hypothetical protein